MIPVQNRCRIYLSPPGVLCCAGADRQTLFDAALRGDSSGIGVVTIDAAPPALEQRFLVGRVPEDRLSSAAAVAACLGLEPDTAFPAPRIFRLADAALEQIRPHVEQALAAYGPGRIGVCVGSCDNGTEWSLKAHRSFFANGGFPEGYDLRFQGAAGPSEYVSRKFGLSGPSLAFATACASSATAIIRGAELIRLNVCDAVIAGGVDIASETVLLGFNSLEAVSGSLCNPFSRNRKGITLGEGAGFFVLSREALEGDIELLGAGESADAYHMTAPRPDGQGAIRAMEAAISDAGIEKGELGYLNLHGTGTIQNDQMEARALASVFPGASPPASSTKPLTGHTLGAAGALELALCWMTLASPLDPAPLPVHVWDGEYDPALPPLHLAAPGDRVSNLGVCMSNSFAFGGCNVSLILAKSEGDGE
ncbi:3-oxoacyl-ACP synthase [Treponema primitia]|uniref:beta-ketoacyl synthase N-terminal-like domain-containing protein n=1 Tax=Treponema primitia TaxID=88058 RepID=UPI003980CE74